MPWEQVGVPAAQDKGVYNVLSLGMPEGHLEAFLCQSRKKSRGKKVDGEDVPAASPGHEISRQLFYELFFFFKFSSSKTKKHGF